MNPSPPSETDSDLLRILATHGRDTLHVLQDGVITYASPSARNMTGFRADEEIGMTLAQIAERIHPDDLASLRETHERLFSARHRTGSYLYRYRHRDGHYFWREDSVYLEYHPDGRVSRAFVVGRDVSERVRSQQIITELYREREATLAAIPDVLIELDEELRYVSVHTPDESLLLADVASMIGQSFAELVPEPARSICLAALERARHERVVHDVIYPLAIQGRLRWWQTAVARKAAGRDGRGAGFLLLAREVTEQHEARERLESLLYVDALTGLATQTEFERRLARKIEALRDTGTGFGVLLIDLDDFNTLVWSQGHEVGQQVLREIALRLRNGLAPDVVLARLARDRYAIAFDQTLESGKAALGAACALVQQVQQILQQDIDLSHGAARVRAHYGLYLSDEHLPPASPAQALRNAEIALYEASTSQSGEWRLYDPGHDLRIRELTALEIELRRAADRQQLQVHWQPVVGRDREVVALEALLRWEHPERGQISPVDFIPLAERSDLIIQLGSWVIEQSAKTLARWAGDQRRRHWRINVNVSLRQLLDPGFADLVLEILRHTACPPDRLVLEITESTLQHDLRLVLNHMHVLAAQGVRFALDDFGTGYSCLSYLQRLPLAFLKIDRSFVQTLENTQDGGEAIARMVLDLGRTLGLSVTAEGVETQAQFDRLIELGCDSFQGWLFGRPGPDIPAGGSDRPAALA